MELYPALKRHSDMSRPSERDQQRLKVEAANARLTRHERMSHFALLLVLLLCGGLMGLVMMQIWDLP
ncbi:hypothetical protein [Microvirga zambiensis]|uniref:hypothetical protein n=1 Tax=Microvirga zambiensis TaxID=1402137 RepID=UPI00191CF635|nr:hypothetical protein [Microvirga zambiensis]